VLKRPARRSSRSAMLPAESTTCTGAAIWPNASLVGPGIGSAWANDRFKPPKQLNSSGSATSLAPSAAACSISRVAAARFAALSSPDSIEPRRQGGLEGLVMAMEFIAAAGTLPPIARRLCASHAGSGAAAGE